VFGDDFAYLQLQAEETALTVEQVVVSMIRKARKAYERPERPQELPGFAAPNPMYEAAAEAAREAEAQRQREIAEKRARLQAELAELDGGTELPNLPEFDERLLRGPEPIFDNAVAAVIPPPRNNGPGSITAPAGVSRELRGGDRIGDPMGNIVRRNFGH